MDDINKNSSVIVAIKASIDVKYKLLHDEPMINLIASVSTAVVNAYRNGGKVLICGNGGSAADAQHIAAELSGKFYFDREPLDAEALHVNTSYITAVGNDYGYDQVYKRLIRAKGRAGDILIGITTSGNSANVVLALQQAKKQGLVTIGFTGLNRGKVDEYCDFLIKVPSSDTPRIQEAHILIGHIICQLVESELFAR